MSREDFEFCASENSLFTTDEIGSIFLFLISKRENATLNFNTIKRTYIHKCENQNSSIKIYEVFSTYKRKNCFTPFFEFKFVVDRQIKIVGLIVGVSDKTKSINFAIKTFDEEILTKRVEIGEENSKIMVQFDPVDIRSEIEYSILVEYYHTAASQYKWKYYGTNQHVSSVINGVKFDNLNTNTGPFFEILFI